jgi:hypothetical protein
MAMADERNPHEQMADFWAAIGDRDRIEAFDAQVEADRIDELMSMVDLEADKRRKEDEEVERWLAEERAFKTGLDDLWMRLRNPQVQRIRPTLHLAWALHSMEFDEMYPF